MRYRLLVALCIASLAGCETPLSEVQVLGTLERDRIELAADTNEPITSILVREGDSVDLGQPLLKQATVRVERRLWPAHALKKPPRWPRWRKPKKVPAHRLSNRPGRGWWRLPVPPKRRATNWNDRSHWSSGTSPAPAPVSIMQGRYDEAMARRDEAAAALDELLEGTRTNSSTRRAAATPRPAPTSWSCRSHSIGQP